MGNVAASGGYWISCSADKIVADPTTLTGSIGVFGLIPNMQGFFNNKLGMTFDYVNTNENSDFPPVSKPLSPYQKGVIEREIDIIYQDFLELVAEGRGMTTDEVHELAQGRIWASGDAFENGLIDQIGGMEDAIQLAAELSGVEEYRLFELPFQKDPFQQLMEDLFGQAKASLIRSELGDKYRYYQYLKDIENLQGIQARLPYEIQID
jgi:protease-4